LANILKQNIQPVNTAMGEQGCPVVLQYANDVAQADIQLGQQWMISPTDEQLLALKYAFGEEAVVMDFGH